MSDPSQPNMLEDILVVDFSQFLSGPSASLRLADFGATVIKVERPDAGDICRQLYVSDVQIDGDSTIFHAINRNKLGYAANLKNSYDKAKIEKLVSQADVVMHNFRPGVADRLGIDYETVNRLNPSVVYAEINGYGKEGPWASKPGQDLLIQAMSGLTWLSGNADDDPTPMGLAVVDIWAGALLVQGILAALVRRGVTHEGGHVEVNMLEAMLDFQFEPMTIHLLDESMPKRTTSNNAHALLGAPYGIYETANGFLALAMARIPQLGELLDCPALTEYAQPDTWYTQRDEIKALLAEHLKTQSTQTWLEALEAADIWCAGVLDWDTLMQHEGFQILDMVQSVKRGTDTAYQTTTCPIRFDRQRLVSPVGSCGIGEHNRQIDRDYRLENPS